MPVARKYRFGNFCLDTVERCLLHDGQFVPLTPKALETLLFLVERHGHIVEKKALMDAVWPNTFVEEVSLARNISVLRKVFSDGEESPSYIETIPKRGYRFVADVSESLQNEEAPPAVAGTSSFGPPSAVVDLARAAPSRTRRGIKWILLVSLIALLAAALTYWITSSHPVLSFASRNWILICDFDNHTGDPRFDKALLTALTVDVEQSRYVNVFARSRVYETLKRMGRFQDSAVDVTVNEALGREICLRENLRALIVADLTRTGSQYRLIVRLVDPKTGGAVRSYAKQIAGEDGILDALDTIAANIRHDLGETLYALRRDDRPMAQVTTASLTALQHYSDGIDLWKKGKYLDGQAQIQEALRIDPDFAMAHAALGANLYSHILSDPKRGKQEYERALQLSNRITDRERMFIEANFAGAQNHAQEAERLYRAFLTNYPDDLTARFDLAYLLLRGNRCEEAIKEFQQLVQIDPSDAHARIEIATCYANNSKYKEALPYYERAFEFDPSRITSENINNEYGFTLVGAGQFDKAREVFSLALQKPQVRARGLRSLGLLDLYLGQSNDAAARFREAIAANDAQGDAIPSVRNHLYLASALDAMGDRDGELRVLDEATQSTKVLEQLNWITYRIGIAYARAGAVEKASRMQEIAKKGGSVDDAASRSDSDRLEGEILLAKGDIVHALPELEKAHSENHPPLTPLTFDSVARADERADRPKQAISAYESLIENQGGNPLGWDVQQPWLEAHYRLARLYAQNGNSARAIQLLDFLLQLWKNADPSLPLLKQARLLRDGLTQ